ncbi:hypothetical protein HanIR_Chr01g0036671 [Helianthus annuus]|nr:hypothetical protein HanIR_Chr01g0036671 [Helianthus annuus]
MFIFLNFKTLASVAIFVASLPAASSPVLIAVKQIFDLSNSMNIALESIDIKTMLGFKKA